MTAIDAATAALGHSTAIIHAATIDTATVTGSRHAAATVLRWVPRLPTHAAASCSVSWESTISR